MATIDWQHYVSNLGYQLPRTHLIEADRQLSRRIKHNKVAIDCGCGKGRDTLYLLERGYQVYAFDKNIHALNTLSRNPLATTNPKLKVRHDTFEEYDFPRANLINASASLYYCDKALFNIVWKRLTLSLESEGLFCGHFIGCIGDNEEPSSIITFTRGQLRQLFSDYCIISWKEKKEYTAELTGERTAWLVYTIIAIKR